MTTDEIPKQFSRKPDPAEPWRYVCPECNAQVNGEDQHRKYRCTTCRTTYYSRELLDRKTGNYGVLSDDNKHE